MKTQTAQTTNGTAVITPEQPETRHTPFPESLPGYGIVSHRPFVGRINEPVRPAKRTPGERSGTLRLDQGGYASPLRDLKGLTPCTWTKTCLPPPKRPQPGCRWPTC